MTWAPSLPADACTMTNFAACAGRPPPSGHLSVSLYASTASFRSPTFADSPRTTVLVRRGSVGGTTPLVARGEGGPGTSCAGPLATATLGRGVGSVFVQRVPT